MSAVAAGGGGALVAPGAYARGEVAEHAHQELDALEHRMLESGLPVVGLPLVHRFVPGLYAREILMPAGTLCTSQTHNTEHLYMVLSGLVRVFVPGEGVVELAAGHVGVTVPGTRRLLYIVEECRWVTCHPLSPEEEEARQDGAADEDLLAAIRERILDRRELPDGRTTFDLYQDRLLEEARTAGILDSVSNQGGVPSVG